MAAPEVKVHRALRFLGFADSLDQLEEWLFDNADGVYLEGRLAPPAGRPSPDGAPQRGLDGPHPDLNPRTLPAPALIRADGPRGPSFKLRWEAKHDPAFWLEVELATRTPQLAGKRIPHDATISRTTRVSVRWDSASVPEFWLQLTFNAAE